MGLVRTRWRRQFWTRSCLLWHLRTLQQSLPRPHGGDIRYLASEGWRSRRGVFPTVGLLANAPRAAASPGVLPDPAERVGKVGA